MLKYVSRSANRTWFERPEGMPEALHRLLIERGIASAEEAERFLHPSARDLLDPMRLNAMPEAVARIRPECTSVSVEIMGERPCNGSLHPGDLRALIDRAADVVERFTGSRPPVRSGSTDCNWPLSLGIPAICIGGYLGAGAHTREEYVDIDSLLPGVRFAFDLILQHFA